ncbi:MAG: hypothetical protein V4671_05955 [Armatimonadota bacterium]
MTDHLVRGVTQHSLGGGIEESYDSRRVGADNCLIGGIQHRDGKRERFPQPGVSRPGAGREETVLS